MISSVLRLQRFVKATSFFVCLFAINFAAAQTVTTDQPDYPPGSTVVITGSGFLAGESVKLQVLHYDINGDNDASAAHQPWYVTADADGNISATWLVPLDEDELGATLLLTADGQDPTLPARHAETTFTDACSISNPSGPSNVTVCTGLNASFTVSASLNGSPCGGLVLTYQWRKNGVNIADGATGNGSTYGGTTTTTLTITGVAAGDAATTATGYDCVVSATGLASKTSGRASLTVKRWLTTSAAT